MPDRAAVSEAEYALETAADPRMPADYLWMLERLYRAAVSEYKDCDSWNTVLSEARMALNQLWEGI